MDQAPAKQIIRVTHLRKIYRVGDERVVALADINLEILQGQIVCIVGTSGSGKSTLLNQLAGLEKPTKGTVHIGKTNISKLSENQLALFRQRHLGFVFQSYNLLPTMSALENVALPMVFKGVPRSKRNKAALAMLAAVGLKKRAHHRPTQMSGGQQQRVGIARAFVTRPNVIFADEPTGNLDTKTTISVMQMMVRFARKYNETLIIVTHDPELSEYSDRVITLIDGLVTSDLLHTPAFDGLGDPVPFGSEAEEPEAEEPDLEEPVPEAEELAAKLEEPVPEAEEPALNVEEPDPQTDEAAPPNLLEQMLADTNQPEEDQLPLPGELPEDIELPEEADFIEDSSELDGIPASPKIKELIP